MTQHLSCYIDTFIWNKVKEELRVIKIIKVSFEISSSSLG